MLSAAAELGVRVFLGGRVLESGGGGQKAGDGVFLDGGDDRNSCTGSKPANKHESQEMKRHRARVAKQSAICRREMVN